METRSHLKLPSPVTWAYFSELTNPTPTRSDRPPLDRQPLLVESGLGSPRRRQPSRSSAAEAQQHHPARTEGVALGLHPPEERSGRPTSGTGGWRHSPQEKRWPRPAYRVVWPLPSPAWSVATVVRDLASPPGS